MQILLKLQSIEVFAAFHLIKFMLIVVMSLGVFRFDTRLIRRHELSSDHDKPLSATGLYQFISIHNGKFCVFVG